MFSELIPVALLFVLLLYDCSGQQKRIFLSTKCIIMVLVIFGLLSPKTKSVSSNWL